MPYVRRDLYTKLLAACDEGTAVRPNARSTDAYSLPRKWDEIAQGHVVLVQESIKDGWWEAVVIARVGDILTLKFRDYPDYEEYQRHVTTVALMRAPPD